ncbi:hypothetical protein [uncultured Azohydromonas sp.]|jgi:hypothetical protein|uniref:hypothetical protein n=1 Tax=uncultured Azohydromonas sp. TaxID=487342 RepID=UPI002630933C|nr:hypothetical protein [uncultured Azohydromonas sp.]
MARRSFKCLFPVMALVALTGAAQAAPDGIRTFTGGAHFFKRVVTNTNPLQTNTVNFLPLPNANTVVSIPANTIVLVNVGFDAETRCMGGGAVNNWCELQILVGGAEANPMASTFGPDTFAMDSTDGGTERVGSWESHAFSRHVCFRNPTSQPLNIPVTVRWRVTNFGGAGVNPPLFWVDDSSLVVELARGCQMVEGPGTTGPILPPGKDQLRL